jgi:hypothetical protein
MEQVLVRELNEVFGKVGDVLGKAGYSSKETVKLFDDCLTAHCTACHAKIPGSVISLAQASGALLGARTVALGDSGAAMQRLMENKCITPTCVSTTYELRWSDPKTRLIFESAFSPANSGRPKIARPWWRFWPDSRRPSNDCIYLKNKKLIDVSASGLGIAAISLTITNTTDQELTITVNVGTIFRAEGSHQDMAVRSSSQLKVLGRKNIKTVLPAVCINAERPIPSETDRFRRLSSAAGDLKKFLDASQHLMPAAIQAGVWAITDRYDKQKVRAKLQTKSAEEAAIWGEFCTTPSIHQSDVNEAKAVLEAIGCKTAL